MHAHRFWPEQFDYMVKQKRRTCINYVYSYCWIFGQGQPPRGMCMTCGGFCK